jgi:ABC-type branched-subunit amino acid transport system substrate-binding protein
VEGYEAEFGEFTSTFGPPSFAAADALLTAIQQACEDAGGTPDRQQVLDAMGNVSIDQSILGGPLMFAEDGDVEGGQFFIFKVTGKGQYEAQTG